MKKFLTLLTFISAIFLIGCTAKAPAEPALEQAVENNSGSQVATGEVILPEVNNNQANDDTEGEDTEEDNGENDDGENTNNTNPTPYSLEALKQEEFIGNDLRLEARLAENASYIRHRISYNSNGIRVSGILNIPQGEGPFPVAILNHGYIDPDVYTVGRGLKREQDNLARAGYAVLHTDYRNHGLSDNDPQLEENYVFRSYFYAQDSINAILALQNRDDTRIDASRVGMLGHSMGGGVAMHAMQTRPELIDAVALYAPVHVDESYNFERRRSEDLSEQERQEREEKLGDLENPENFRPYSAYPGFSQRASEYNIPVKIYHGTNDQSVPYAWSETAREELSEAGANVELITYKGEAHEFITRRPDFINSVIEFFDANVR